MPNRRNATDSSRLQLTTTPGVIKCLDAIASTEIYGKNRAEVADRLLSEGIRRLIGDGVIKMPVVRARRKKAARRKRGSR